MLSHHSQDIPVPQLDSKTLLHSELLARMVLSSPTSQVVLHLLPPNPLLPTWMCLIMSSSCWLVFSDVTDKSVRMSNRHLLISLLPGFHKHLSCTSFTFFHSLCLLDSVCVRIHPCFSCQGSLNDRSDALSAFIVVRLWRFSMRCKRCTTWAASRVSVSFNVRRQDVESNGFNLWRSFNHNPSRWESLSLGSCDLPSQFVDSQSSLNIFLVQLLLLTTPFLVMHKTAPVGS